jgi:hypothetical protein
MMKRMSRTMAAAAALAAAAAQGGEIGYEGFDGYPENYPDGTAPAKAGSVFVDWRPQNAGRMNVQSAGGLAYGALPVTTGYLNMSSGGTSMAVALDVSAEGPFADYLDGNGRIGRDGTTLYVSFLYHITEPSSEQGYLQFYDATVETMPYDGARFGVGHGWGVTTPVKFNGVTGNPLIHNKDGQTHFVVIRIDYKAGNDEIRVWLDPNLSAAETDLTPVVGPVTRDAAFNSFFFQSQGRDADGDTYFFDELRLASDWNSALGGVPLMPPAPPQELTARAISGEAVLLQWQDTNLNETGYVIERAAGVAGPWDAVVTTAADAARHIDTGLAAQTAYAYRVRGLNTNGTGDATPAVEVTTLGAGQSLPAAPTNQHGEVDGGGIRLTWTDVADDEFAYRVYRAKGDGELERVAEINANTTGFADTTAPVGVELRYALVSVNAYGESLVSEILTVGPIPEPTSGPDWVWIEGENYETTTFPMPGNTTLEPADAFESGAASGGTLFGRMFTLEERETDRTFEQTYRFTAPSDGTYSLYIRNLSNYGPFHWRIDEGEWIAANTYGLPELERVPYRTNFSLTWQNPPGTVDLIGGREYTFTARVNLATDFPEIEGAMRFRWMQHYGWDAFLFTASPFSPAGKAKPGIKSALHAPGFFPFEPELDTYADPSPIDLSYLNEDVAGQSGWVWRSGSDYFLGSGEKVRFVGATIRGGTLSSYIAQARFLAKRGVNLVRWHGHIFDDSPTSDSINNISEGELATVQQAVAAMKTEGIYTNLSMFFPLTFRVREQWNIPGFDAAYIAANDRAPYGLFIWNDTFKDAYKHWITELLTRPNPYDPQQTPLGQDPAVMNFEIINEDNLFWFSFNPSNYPVAQRELLYRKFGDWVVAKYGSIDAAYAAWGGGQRGNDNVALGLLEVEAAGNLRAGTTARYLRQRDQLRFQTEVQKNFWAEIRDLVRSLGYQGPVSATNWRTARDVVLRDVEYYTYTETDVVDLHNYFAPQDVSALSYRVSVGDTYRNLSAVDRPAEISTAMKQVEGLVSMVSEFSWVNPSDLGAEAPLITSAYASLQDIDALMWFVHGSIGFDTVLQKWQVGGPAVMGQFPGANLLYRRDAAPEAPVVVREGRSLESLMRMEGSILVQNSGFDPTRDSVYDPEQGTGSLGIEAALIGKVELAFGDSDRDFVHPELPQLLGAAASSIRSVTGQLEIDRTRGIFKVDTPRSQGVTSYLGDAGPVELADTVISMNNAFGSVLVISLDGLPVAQSARLLIQAATREQTYGYATEPSSIAGQPAFKITDVGSVPFNVEEIDAEVRLRGFAGASAEYLDPNGYPVAAPVHYDQAGDLVVKLPFNALYTVVTRDAPAGGAPQVWTAEARSAVEGLPYSFRLEGFSPRGPLTWTLAGGSLPGGITLAADGTLTGTTTQDGFHTFTVQASDGSAHTTADIALRVIRTSPDAPTLVLTPDQWGEYPPLGFIWGYTESWGYADNLGVVYTGFYPWLYQFPLGWLYFNSASEGYLYFYHVERGWLIRQAGSPWFLYFNGTDWVWDSFLDPAP